MAQSEPMAGDPAVASRERSAQLQLWHTILDIHGTIFARLNHDLVREFGITLAKFDVLAQLDRSPEGLTQIDLSRQLKVTGGNVTGLVRRMIADGLISRETSSSDRRAFVVQLTAHGRTLYRSARKRHDALLAQTFGAFGDERAVQARDILRQLAHAMVRPANGDTQ